jgi:hypothetical protein
MNIDNPFFSERTPVKSVTRDAPGDPGDPLLATRDHAVIREWARLVGAEPATGEATASGRASSMKVVDGGSGLRFNFPGVGRFREISWTEWFDHFNRHDLTFVFDNPGASDPPSARYRIVLTSDLAM